MNPVIGQDPPTGFRIAAWLGLIWSLIGVAMYLQSVGLFGDPRAGLSAPEIALFESVPGWVKGAFALATFGGAIGCIGLLLLRRWGRGLLALSLLAVIAQNVWVLGISEARTIHGASAFVMPCIITIVALLLVLLANRGVARGWLR